MKQQPASIRKKVVARYAIIGLCCGLAVLAAPFAANAVSDWSKAREQATLEKRYGRVAEYPEALKRVEAIEAESGASSAPPWAGRYSMGDGLTNNAVYLAPKSGVVATWSSDTLAFDAEAGTVEMRPDGSLHLAFDHPREPVLLYTDFVPVRWGAYRYLIAVEEMPAFLHDINRNEVPSVGMGTGRYLVATGVRNGKAEDRQALPAAYEGWVREKAATATVLAVRSDDAPKFEPPYFACAKWQATLAVARADALHAGEVLDAEGPDRNMLLLVLDRVDGEHASGRILMKGECDGTQPVPAAGWVFTTGAYDPAAARR
ncbi:MAG TPA: hypothetical protein VGH80_15980 [Xanthomonadaceae bacterium]|jgi:hypothetical protein